jgi:hypothetical protein
VFISGTQLNGDLDFVSDKCLGFQVACNGYHGTYIRQMQCSFLRSLSKFLVLLETSANLEDDRMLSTTRLSDGACMVGQQGEFGAQRRRSWAQLNRTQPFVEGYSPSATESPIRSFKLYISCPVARSVNLHQAQLYHNVVICNPLPDSQLPILLNPYGRVTIDRQRVNRTACMDERRTTLCLVFKKCNSRTRNQTLTPWI